MITSISHMTFIVKDLDKATIFFTDIFDAVEVYSSNDMMFSLSKEKFFLINDLWICIMEGESLPTRTYNHIAFKINEKDYDIYLDRINKLNLEIKDGRPRVNGESSSIYYDNHLFELHTGTLKRRLATYNR